MRYAYLVQTQRRITSEWIIEELFEDRGDAEEYGKRRVEIMAEEGFPYGDYMVRTLPVRQHAERAA